MAGCAIRFWSDIARGNSEALLTDSERPWSHPDLRRMLGLVKMEPVNGARVAGSTTTGCKIHGRAAGTVESSRLGIARCKLHKSRRCFRAPCRICSTSTRPARSSIRKRILVDSVPPSVQKLPNIFVQLERADTGGGDWKVTQQLALNR